MQVVVVTEPLSDAAASWLAARADVRLTAPGQADFDEALARARGLVVRTYTTVDAALLDRAPNLQVVGRAGVGYDNIDVAACRARSIEVVHTPGANTQAVVEFVLGLILQHRRPTEALRTAVDAEAWRELRAATTAERQLSELTLGILGLGRIGQRLAEVVQALGGPVIYNDLREIPVERRFGAEPVSVPALFAQSDVLSIHVDGRPSNRGFVGSDLLGGLPPDALLINTSRGMVVDRVALSATLRDRPGMTALLDVHDPEPFVAGDSLLRCANAELYPHIAGRTRTALENMSWVVRDVIAVLEGRSPKSPVAG